jgi:cohesin loading factor subunit SCC2
LSPAVRDAAVELIGKYIVQMPELAGDYYRIISDRIAVSCYMGALAVINIYFLNQDTGLGVRKRIIKLLKGM